MITIIDQKATTGEEGVSESSPVGQVIAAMDGESKVRLAKATADDAIMYSDVLTHTLLSSILLTLKKMNYHLQSINDDDFITDEDVT